MSIPPRLTPQFVQILDEVRSNDPSRKRILENEYVGCVGYGALLGEALCGNTFVSEIDLPVCNLVSETVRETIWNYFTVTGAAPPEDDLSLELALLLDYLRGPIVKKLKLADSNRMSSGCPSVVASVLLQAIAANPNPVAIDCHMTVDLHKLSRLFREARQSFVNTSLENLCLHDIRPNNNLAVHILEQLHSHPKLHTLALVANSEQPIPLAVSALVNSNIAQESKLHTVTLGWFNVTSEDREATLGAILRHHDKPVLNVSLERCSLDAGAAQGLVQLIQTEPVKERRTGSGGSSTSSVTDLRLDRPSPELLQPHNLASLMVPSLAHPLVRVTLLKLNLSTLAQLQVLASSLPQARFLTTLQFLYTGGLGANATAASAAGISAMAELLVQGLKHNESLLVFEEFFPSERRGPSFSPRLQRKIESYLDRNRHLATALASTLASPTMTTTTPDAAATIPVVSAADTAEAIMTTGQQEAFAPSLLVSASHAPRMLATQLVKNLNNAQVASSTLLFGPIVATVTDAPEEQLVSMNSSNRD